MKNNNRPTPTVEFQKIDVNILQLEFCNKKGNILNGLAFNFTIHIPVLKSTIAKQ